MLSLRAINFMAWILRNIQYVQINCTMRRIFIYFSHLLSMWSHIPANFVVKVLQNVSIPIHHVLKVLSSSLRVRVIKIWQVKKKY